MKIVLFLCATAVLLWGSINPEIKKGNLNVSGDTALLVNRDDYKIYRIIFNDSQRRQMHFRNDVLFLMFDYIVDPNAAETVYEGNDPVPGFQHGVELTYHLNGQARRKRYFSRGYPVGADYNNDSMGRTMVVNHFSTTSLSHERKRMDMYLDGVLFYKDSFDERGYVTAREVLNDEAYATRGRRGFGRFLYEINNCSSCHDLYEKRLGPALAGIGRKEGRDFVYHYIQDNIEFRKTNKKARQVYNDNGGMAMATFRHLTREDIHLIIDYLDSFKEK